MKTDFIKWKVGYAEGFVLINDGDDIFPDWVLIYNNGNLDPLAGDFDKTAECSLLLQRAIEGINLEMGIYQIDITKDCIEVWGNGLSKKIVLIKGKLHEYTFDEAKEQALKYIWEQETK